MRRKSRRDSHARWRVTTGSTVAAPTMAGLALAALTLAGCGGGSSGNTGAGASAAGASPPATASAVASNGSAGVTGTSPSAVGSGGRASSAAPRSSAASSGTGAKPPGRASGFARPGTYTYDLSGTSASPLGHNDISGTGTLTEDVPQGARQHSTQSGQDGNTELTVDARSSGLYLAEIKITSQGFNEDFRPAPAVLYFPADDAVGRHWSWSATSTDGKYAIHVTSRISGRTTEPVGGRSLPALVVDSVLHITGSGFDLTDNQRDWVSTTYALTLKEHAVTNGTAYGAKFSSDVTRTLRSTTPG